MDTVKYYGCYDYNEEWYLIEFALDFPPSEIDLSKIFVPEQGLDKEDWQTPYMEQYLNADGTAKICETYKIPSDRSPCRVVFFLYKVSADTLSTPYGDFPLSTGAKVPVRLEHLIDFEED